MLGSCSILEFCRIPEFLESAARKCRLFERVRLPAWVIASHEPSSSLAARTVTHGATAAPLPPLNDMEAHRHWLAGFGAAWVERQDALSLDDALHVALRGQAALLRQLRAHGLNRTTRTLQ